MARLVVSLALAGNIVVRLVVLFGFDWEYRG